MNAQAHPSKKKPVLRGVSHQIAAFVAAVAGAGLIYRTARSGFETPWPLVGNTGYVASLVFLFAMSAFYHRPTWKPEWRRILRKFDHAAIYLLIAGTGTAVGLAPFQSQDAASQGLGFLPVFWVGCAFGILKSLLWAHAPKPLTVLIYVGVALSALPYLSDIATQLGGWSTALILLGGALHITGAVIYALKRPDPWPEFFGYHEIFHLLVIAGAGFQYLAILRTVA